MISSSFSGEREDAALHSQEMDVDVDVVSNDFKKQTAPHLALGSSRSSPVSHSLQAKSRSFATFVAPTRSPFRDNYEAENSSHRVSITITDLLPGDVRRLSSAVADVSSRFAARSTTRSLRSGVLEKGMPVHPCTQRGTVPT